LTIHTSISHGRNGEKSIPARPSVGRAIMIRLEIGGIMNRNLSFRV
jgi:hypothetical protein